MEEDESLRFKLESDVGVDDETRGPLTAGERLQHICEQAKRVAYEQFHGQVQMLGGSYRNRCRA